MNPSMFVPHLADLAGWFRVAFVQMLILGVFEIIGREYGPLVKPRYPVLYEVLAATWRVIRQVANKFPMAKQPDPAPRAAGGFTRVHLALVLSVGILVLPILSLCLHGCSGTAVQQQMRAADVLGLTANHAAPLWLAAFEREGKAAADAACPFERALAGDLECRAVRHAAVDRVTARWSHVRDQWEIARVAHDAYSECLEFSRDGGVCLDLTARQHALEAAVTAYRCEVRALGHVDLDVVPGAAPVCNGGSQ